MTTGAGAVDFSALSAESTHFSARGHCSGRVSPQQSAQAFGAGRSHGQKARAGAAISSALTTTDIAFIR